MALAIEEALKSVDYLADVLPQRSEALRLVAGYARQAVWGAASRDRGVGREEMVAALKAIRARVARIGAHPCAGQDCAECYPAEVDGLALRALQAATETP